MQLQHMEPERHMASGSWWLAEPRKKEVRPQASQKTIALWDELDDGSGPVPDGFRLLNLRP